MHSHQIKGRMIDISPLLSPRSAVWPGDTPLTREILCDINQGSHIDLSTLRATVHLGAHADAPRHFHGAGATIDQISLETYIGACAVKTVSSKPLITASDCLSVLQLGVKRVLFRTLTAANHEVFNTDFTAFSPEAIECLGQASFKLVGIDTPSVDPFDSKDLPAHQMLYKYGIANIEGLTLAHVSDGIYEFIGFPLKLEGFDASPIRAVLRTL